MTNGNFFFKPDVQQKITKAINILFMAGSHLEYSDLAKITFYYELRGYLSGLQHTNIYSKHQFKYNNLYKETYH